MDIKMTGVDTVYECREQNLNLYSSKDPILPCEGYERPNEVETYVCQKLGCTSRYSTRGRWKESRNRHISKDSAPRYFILNIRKNTTQLDLPFI